MLWCFPASWVRSYQSNLLSWHLGGRSLTLPGPLLLLASPWLLLGREDGLLLDVTSLVGRAKCRIFPTATSKVMLMCSVSGFPGLQKLHSSVILKNRNCAYQKKPPQKAPPETLLKLPHFHQTAVQSLPSALLRKGPDEGAAPNSSCKISLWHAAAWTPWGLVWQVVEMLQTPLGELLRCHLEQAAVAHKLILLILLHVTMG